MNVALLFLPLIIIGSILLSKKGVTGEPWFLKYFDWSSQILIGLIVIVFIKIVTDFDNSKTKLLGIASLRQGTVTTFLQLSVIKECTFMMMTIAMIFSKRACTVDHFKINYGSFSWSKVNESHMIILYSILCLFTYYYFISVFFFNMDITWNNKSLLSNHWLYYPTFAVLFFAWPTINRIIKRNYYELPKSKHLYK